jgi:uncharacterized protein
MMEQDVESIPKAKESTAGAHEGAESPAYDGWVDWCRGTIRNSLVVPLIASRHPPWYDARGVSLGLAVGFGVPLGAQFIVLGLLRSLYRFNLIIALAFSFVSNPLTMIPVYYGYYRLGAFVLGKTTAMDFSVFRRLMSPISDSAYSWEATAAFANLGKDLLTTWIVAAIFLSVTFGIIGYAVTYKIQQMRCIRKARKMGLKYEEFLQDLEEQSRGSERRVLPQAVGPSRSSTDAGMQQTRVNQSAKPTTQRAGKTRFS